MSAFTVRSSLEQAGGILELKCRHLGVSLSQVYAMKSMLKDHMILKNQVTHVKAERDVMAEADDPWIVKLMYSFQVR